MQVVLLVHDTGYHYELSAERDGGSTYAYDYSLHETEGEQCDTHETGTLETYAGVPEGFLGDWSRRSLSDRRARETFAFFTRATSPTLSGTGEAFGIASRDAVLHGSPRARGHDR